MRRSIALLIALAVAGTMAIPAIAATPTKTVKIGDYFFSPHELSVSKGTEVTWKWTGAIVHDVAVVKGPVKFHSHKQLKGTYSYTFTRKGTYSLHCTIHPTMKETITVS